MFKKNLKGNFLTYLNVYFVGAVGLNQSISTLYRSLF